MGSVLKDAMGDLVASLVESYGEHAIIRNIDSEKRLDRERIIWVCDTVRQLLFPGYFEYRRIQGHTVRYHVGELLEAVSYELSKQVEKAFDFADGQECPGGRDDGGNRERAEQAVAQFLRRLAHLRELLAKDVQAAYEGDPAASSTDEVIFSYPGLYAVTVFRVAHELHALGIPMIPRIMTEHAHSLTGIDIHPGADIGEYFFIDHGTGVVIGETTVIGSHVKIYQGVTLGGLSTKGGQSLRSVKRHPTLKDHVTVYAGASILGGETVVGEGAVIGSNAFITSSVPDHTRVSIKNPELQYKVRGAVRTQELGQEGFFAYAPRDEE